MYVSHTLRLMTSTAVMVVVVASIFCLTNNTFILSSNLMMFDSLSQLHTHIMCFIHCWTIGAVDCDGGRRSFTVLPFDCFNCVGLCTCNNYTHTSTLEMWHLTFANIIHTGRLLCELMVDGYVCVCMSTTDLKYVIILWNGAKSSVSRVKRVPIIWVVC